MLNLLLTLIFLRPFISSLAFPYLNFFYSSFLILALLAWFSSKGISLKGISPLKIPLFLFMISLAVSTVFSFNKTAGLNESYNYIIAVLLLVFASSLGYEDKIKITRMLIFSAIIIAIFGIYQYFFGFKHILEYLARENISNPFAIEYISTQRIFFPFIGPNALGGYLVMIFPLIIVLKRKTLPAVIILSAIFFTRSLGAIFSLITAVLLYFALIGRNWKKISLFLLASSIFFAAVISLRLSLQKEQFLPVFSGIMRLKYYAGTLRLIKHHFLSGVGIGNFNLPDSRYAHNSFLQFWAETGILGFFSLIWLAAAVLIKLYRKIKNKVNSGNLYKALFLANSVFLLHNFIDFTFFLPEIAMIWWVIFGMSLGEDKIIGAS